ncbi:MAG TPA: hypothetical protein VF772_02090, partial [Terriglobales bacterium]
MPVPLQPDDESEKYPGPTEQFPTGMPQYEATMAKLNAAGGIASVGAPIDHRPTVSEQLMMRKAHL